MQIHTVTTLNLKAGIITVITVHDTLTPVVQRSLMPYDTEILENAMAEIESDLEARNLKLCDAPAYLKEATEAITSYLTGGI